MNIQGLVTWLAGLVIAAACIGHLEDLQRWIWIAELRLTSDSKTSSWGSPRFFPRSGAAQVPLRQDSLSPLPQKASEGIVER